MSEDESPIKIATDLVGIAPVAKAVEKLTEASLDGAGALFGRLCLPAAEEFGLMIRDQISAFRKANLDRIAAKTRKALEANMVPESASAHPRLVCHALQEGSWNDDPIVQDLWAGLLSSSCTDDGNDDSNLIFVTLLTNMSKLQARLMNHLCEHPKKELIPITYLVECHPVHLSVGDLV